MSRKGVEEITCIDGSLPSINASLHIQILNEKMTHTLKTLGRRGIFQRDRDPKRYKSSEQLLCLVLVFIKSRLNEVHQ